MPLTAYYNEPWLRRAKLTSSLLDAAYKFTYKNENFGFYLTDVSADNVAVDSADNIKFVDLENIIVVDKSITPTGILKVKCLGIFFKNNDRAQCKHSHLD